MDAAPKHSPFQSIYRQDFEVLEERQGKLRLYPHTGQLPLLLRALNFEFYGALPDNIARTDKRGDGFHKIMLKSAAVVFCSAVNSRRKDAVRLLALPDADLVFKVTVAQQITEETKRGPVHRFRFYGGPDFFPEIFMSGRRLAFTDHVLERFSSRVPNRVGDDLSLFLISFFGSPHLAMPVGPSRAFIIPWQESILAFPFREPEDDEFVITTCLTINETHSLVQEFPPLVGNLCYRPSFIPPKIRHWMPTKWMLDLHAKWERKVPMPPPLFGPEKMDWHQFGLRVKDSTQLEGHGPGSQFFFLDHVPGPCFFDVKPGKPEPRADELAFYKIHDPKVDWDARFARRDDSLKHEIDPH